MAGAALLVLVWQAHAALTLSPLPRAAGDSPALDVPMLDERTAPEDETLIVQTVAQNPMRESRRRAAGRYRLPGESVEAMDVEPESDLSPPPEFAVAGVALGPGQQSFVALLVNRSDSRLLSVGDTVHGLSVSKIGRDQVSLARPDTTIVLVVPDPFRQVASP